MARKVHKSRKWLNKPGHQSFGAIIWKVSFDPAYNEILAEMSISDCNRVVNLDFDVFLDPGDAPAGRLANIEYKANVLRNEVNTFCDLLLTQIDQLKAKDKEE